MTTSSRLSYRPPVGLIIILAFIIIIAGVSAVSFTPDRNLLTLEIGATALAAIFWFNNAGYRVAYDDTRLYMRDFGFWNRRLRWPDFHAIAYDDMALIEVRTQNPGPQGTRYVPGEYLAIVSARPEDEEIWIYPQALREVELADLLAHLARRRPDLMPSEVTSRLDVT